MVNITVRQDCRGSVVEIRVSEDEATISVETPISNDCITISKDEAKVFFQTALKILE